jgi:hypothetical protein
MVMGDIDEGGLKALVELGKLSAGLDAKFRVKFERGSSKRKTFGSRTHSTPNSHTLTLTAREFPWACA